MSHIYGYAHLSATGRNASEQRDALIAAGCSDVRIDRNGRRIELAKLRARIRPGDTLVCTRLDRLTLSLRELKAIASDLRMKGAHLRATEQSIDTSTKDGES